MQHNNNKVLPGGSSSKLPSVNGVHPESFTCPILGTIMCDPVVLSDGHTYERVAILNWFGKENKKTSPYTGEELTNLTLVPNYALKRAIEEYCEGNEERMKEREYSANVQFVTTKLSAIHPTTSTTPAPPPAPWEFDKSKLRTVSPASSSSQSSSSPPMKRPVMVAASRASLSNGTGMLSVWEPTADGERFSMATSILLQPQPKNGCYDASLTCLEPSPESGFGTILAGGRDGRISAWRVQRDVRTGAVSLAQAFTSGLEKHSDEVTSICLLKQSGNLLDEHGEQEPLLVSGSKDRSIRLWGKTAVGWRAREVLHTSCEIKCVTANTEGMIFAGGNSWDLYGWDAGNARDEPVLTLSNGHTKYIRCCTAEQRLIASGADDECVCIWDARLGEGERMVQKLEAGSPVLTCDWGEHYLVAGGGTSPDSMTAGSDNVGGWVRVWDTRTWQVLGDCSKAGFDGGEGKRMNATRQSTYRATGEFKLERQAHNLGCYSLRTFDLVSRPCIISCGDDKMMRLWISPPKVKYIFSESEEFFIPFSPKPKLVFEFGGDAIGIAVEACADLLV